MFQNPIRSWKNNFVKHVAQILFLDGNRSFSVLPGSLETHGDNIYAGAGLHELQKD